MIKPYLRYTDCNAPHISIMETDKWEEKMSGLKLNNCQWCGEKLNLCIVHLGKPPNYRNLWYDHLHDSTLKWISSDEARKKRYNGDLSRELEKYPIDACPKCGRSRLRERKVKRPKYACNYCSHTFDIPSLRKYDKRITESTTMLKWQEKMVKAVGDDLEREYEVIVQNAASNYTESSNDVVTLCGTCKDAFEDKKILCRCCKTEYHDKRFEMCFFCALERSQIIKCKECDKYKRPAIVDGEEFKICYGCYCYQQVDM